MNIKQSSIKPWCIKIVICDNKITCDTTQLVSNEEMIRVFECCLRQLKDGASLDEVPMGKEK